MSASVLSRPLLENGDMMDVAEFRRRYEASEDLEHVELIEGIVYMPSPIGPRDHAGPQALVLGWLIHFQSLHPDVVRALGPGTVWMDEKNAPEPDAMLCRAGPRLFGPDGYLEQAPELIVEIANSSRSRDLHQTKAAYERNGVPEYIVLRVKDKAVDWFALRAGRYEMRTPDQSGVIESEVFPGLRLHVASLLAGDAAALFSHLR